MSVQEFNTAIIEVEQAWSDGETARIAAVPGVEGVSVDPDVPTKLTVNIPADSAVARRVVSSIAKTMPGTPIKWSSR